MTLAGFLGFVWVMYDAFRNGGPGSSPLDLEILPGVPMLPVGFLAFLFGGIVYGLGTTASKAARKRQQQRTRRRPMRSAR